MTLIEKQLERIEKAIIGNGHEGLIARTARIEENVDSVMESNDEAIKKLNIAASALSSLTTDLRLLTQSVFEHHKAEHFSDLIKKKSFWFIVASAFIVMHSISTALELGVVDIFKVIFK
jgi:hypothetical protein